jgi:hypothetical protein
MNKIGIFFITTTGDIVSDCIPYQEGRNTFGKYDVMQIIGNYLIS